MPAHDGSPPDPISDDENTFELIPELDALDTPPSTSTLGDSDIALGSEVGIDAPPTAVRRQPKVILCPYCGHTQPGSEVKGNRCGQCGGLFEPLSRRATQIAMGPWTIRDKANPFRPGFSYEVLKKMIASGRVTPTTVLRGPTTRQFWSIARNVPGVAHLLGFCHKCGKHVELDAKQCPNCAAWFKSVKTRNELGLLFPNRKAAEAAQRSLNRLLGLTPEPGSESAGVSQGSAAGASGVSAAVDSGRGVEPMDTEDAGNGSRAGSAFDPDDAMGDLLDDVLGPSVPGGLPVKGQKVEPLDFAPSSAAEAEELPPSPVKTPKRKSVPPPPLLTTTPSPLAETTSAPNPAALPPRSGLSPLVWALIGLNVLVAGGVIWFVLTQQSPAN